MATNTVIARQELDAAFTNVQLPLRPASGWIRSIRSAFGMSTTQLGQRAGISQSQVVRIEQSEMNGEVGVGQLIQLADAMDCDVQWIVTPRISLEETARLEALAKATEMIERVANTMALEMQSLTAEQVNQMVMDRASELLSSPRLWS